MKLMRQQLKNAKRKIHAPAINLPPPPLIAPGAQRSSGDAVAAAQQASGDAQRRRGINHSVFAGETGGFGGSNLGSGGSLLG